MIKAIISKLWLIRAWKKRNLGDAFYFIVDLHQKMKKKVAGSTPKKKKGGRKKSSVALSGSKLAYGTKLIGLMMRRQSP